MNALTELYLILSFPIAFILHDAEEVVVQHRWMLYHKDSLTARFPKIIKMVEHLSGLTTKALLVHIGQAIVLRGYVPGLVSTILLLPYAFVVMQSIWNAISGKVLYVWGIIGVIIMVVNLRFAHWLGMMMTK